MIPATFALAIYRDVRGIETDPRSDEEHLSAAVEWLYHSQDVTGCGGSAAYYSLVTGWAGPYPETSGYIVSTLYDYAEYADATEARQRARKMADWLLSTQLDCGGFPEGVDPGPDTDPSVFNTGQIILGLVRAYKESGEQAFVDAIDSASRWLFDVQHEDGYWDQFDYRDEMHSYCSRVAWALLEAEGVTGNDAFRESAVANLRWVRSMQTETDWFEHAGFSPSEVPYLHTIAYTVRGLLEGGLALDDDRLVSAARATADRLLSHQREEGSLRGAYDGDWNGADFYCLTGNAQIAVVWLRLYELCGDDRYREAASTEISFLKRHHALGGSTGVRGAIKGSLPVWERYMRLRYPNWAAKFFCDALMITSRT